MKSKRLLLLIGSLCLALMLALPLVGACAAPTPAPTPAAPEKVWNWHPSTWVPAGTCMDRLVYVCDLITEASGGRIVCEPTAPGAICPVEEQLDMVATGATPAMFFYPDYYSGKIPLYVLSANACYLMDSMWEMRQYIERQRGGRMLELIREATAEYGDVYVVGMGYQFPYMPIVSTVPVYSTKDIAGMKFRCGDVPIAKAFGALGAAVTWFPGPEIYTALATGVVDAVTFAHPGDSIALGFHEVTKYWVKYPIAGAVANDHFVVNGEVWRELPDDLKAVVETAVAAGNAFSEYEHFTAITKGWMAAEDYGVELIEWSEEDALEWKKTVAAGLPDFAVDAASTEAVEILEEFFVEWKPALAELIGLA